jgi:Ca2+-transporting ATPase
MLRQALELQDLAIVTTCGATGNLKDRSLDDDAWTIRYLVLHAGAWLSRRKMPRSTSRDARTSRPRDCAGRHMAPGAVEGGVVMAVVTLLALDLFLPGGLIEPVDARLGAGPYRLERARTAAFTVLVLTQLFNSFNARSASASALRDPFSNRWLRAAVALSTTLQVAVVHLPFLNLAFGTVPLSAGQWCVCVAMASGVLWFIERRKLLRRLFAYVHHRTELRPRDH